MVAADAVVDSAEADAVRQEAGADSVEIEAEGAQEVVHAVDSLAVVVSAAAVEASAAGEEARPEVEDIRCTKRSMMHWRWRLAYKSGMAAALAALRTAMAGAVRYLNAVRPVKNYAEYPPSWAGQ